MFWVTSRVTALAIVGVSISAAAQTPPPPPPPEAKAQAMPYVTAAGQSDLYEINSSKVALEKAQDPAIRRFAQMMIDHHQKTTLATMKAAKKAGLSPVLPAPNPGVEASINELQIAGVGDFDRLYLGQQLVAHQAALDLHQSYGATGDQAVLRTSARAAVPIVRRHLADLERMRRGAPDKPAAM